VSGLARRLCYAAGHQVDVQTIAFNAVSRWARERDVQSLTAPPDEFEYRPGTMPPVSADELDAMRARYREDLDRARADSAEALSLLNR
jgi:hypothetical protein